MIRFSELANMFFLTGAAVVLLKIIFRHNNAILWLDARLLLGCMLSGRLLNEYGIFYKRERCHEGRMIKLCRGERDGM